MTKETAKAKTFESYCKNKCIIGYGIINGIINAIIFACIEWGHFDTEVFDWGGVLSQMALNGILLGWILFPIVVPLTKMDRRKGAYELPTAEPAMMRFVPKGYWLTLFITGIVSLIVAVIASVVITLILSALLGMPLSCMTMFWIKLIVCAVTGCVAGYITILFVSR